MKSAKLFTSRIAELDLSADVILDNDRLKEAEINPSDKSYLDEVTTAMKSIKNLKNIKVDSESIFSK